MEGGLAIPFFGFSFWSREMGLKPTATLGKQHPRIVLSAAGDLGCGCPITADYLKTA